MLASCCLRLLAELRRTVERARVVLASCASCCCLRLSGVARVESGVCCVTGMAVWTASLLKSINVFFFHCLLITLVLITLVNREDKVVRQDLLIWCCVFWWSIPLFSFFYFSVKEAM